MSPGRSEKHCMLTAYLPKGSAVELVRMLNAEKGVDTANVASGRGLGFVQSVNYGGYCEVDILTLVVSQDRTDEIFEFVHDRADIDRFGNGLLFQSRLEQTTEYVLPEMDEES